MRRPGAYSISKRTMLWIHCAPTHVTLTCCAAWGYRSDDFLALWKDADPDIPIMKEAKAECAKLR
jgi:hypothetical protein